MKIDEASIKEQMNELLEKHKHVFELRDKFSIASNDMDIQDIENALAMFLSHIYISLCESAEEAQSRLAILYIKIKTGIDLYNDSDLTSWDKKIQ